MKFVKTALKLVLVLMNLLNFVFSANIEMSIVDKQICMGCLNIIKILRNVRNSSVCDSISQTSFMKVVGVDLNKIPKNELMCYEIYYYFYFFQPSFFKDNGYNYGFEYILNTYDMGESVQSDCNACAYLDKCEYYGCVNHLIKPKKIEENNQKIKEVITSDVNILPIIPNSNIKEIDNLRLDQKFSNITVFEKSDWPSIMKVNNVTNNKIKLTGKSYINNKTLHLSNSSYSSHLIPTQDEISFISKSVSKSHKHMKLHKNKSGQSYSSFYTLLNNHFVLAKVKIEHMLDEIFNLAKIHKSIQDMKKKVINYLISKKLQTHLPNEINLTPLKIGNQDNLRNYENDIRRITDKLQIIFNEVKIEILENSNEFLENLNLNSLNDFDTNPLNISIEYLVSFVNCYNELYILGNSIFQSNIKNIKNIQKFFNKKQQQDDKDQIKRKLLFTPKINLEINHENENVIKTIDQVNSTPNPVLNNEKYMIKENVKEKIMLPSMNKIGMKINKITSESENEIKVPETNIIEKNNYKNLYNRVIGSDLDIRNFVSKNRTDNLNSTKTEAKINTYNNKHLPISDLQNLNLKDDNFTQEIHSNFTNNNIPSFPALEIMKFNETKLLLERLQRLEKEQEKFNLLLKNSSLIGVLTENLTKMNKDNFVKPSEKQNDYNEDKELEDYITDDLDEDSLDDRSQKSLSYNLKDSFVYEYPPLKNTSPKFKRLNIKSSSINKNMPSKMRSGNKQLQRNFRIEIPIKESKTYSRKYHKKFKYH